MASKGNPKIHQVQKKEYFFWKARMKVYLRSQDPDLAKVIKNGPSVPEKLVPKSIEGEQRIPEHMVPKTPSDFSKEDKEDVQKDARARNFLFSAIDNEMLNIIMSCGNAKEVWDTIEVVCEGTRDVKENKLQDLTQEYESFNSKSGETLEGLFGRLKRLLNDLKLYGKNYSNQDICGKFMRALPRAWDPKTIVTEEAKDLKVITLDELFGNLQTYKVVLKNSQRFCLLARSGD